VRLYRAKSPLAKVPALELDDGRVLTETRAICTYLEGLFPRAQFDGQWALKNAPSSKWQIGASNGPYCWGLRTVCATPILGLAVLEQPQFADFGQSQAVKVLEVAQWYDQTAGASALDGGRAL
jgi:hypothetical protein